MNPYCESLQEDLLAYQDHELSLARRLVVRWHLARCAACRQELKIMETISDKLRSTESAASGQTATLDPALRNKILSSVAGEAPALNAAPAQPPSGARALPREARPRFKLQLVEGLGLGLAALTFCFFALNLSGQRMRAGFSDAAKNISTSTGYESHTSTDSTAARPAVSSTSASGMSGGTAHEAPAASPPDSFRKSAAQSNQAFSRFDGNYVRPATRPSTPLSPGTGASTDSLPSSLRRVHKEGRITVDVAKVEDQSDTVIAYVKSAGGYVSDNTLSTGADGLKMATLTVRVPVGKFETVLSQIAKLGDVKAKNISGEDITEKFSDAEQADRILDSELTVKESQLKQALQREANDKKHRYMVPWQQRAEVRELRIQAAQAKARKDLLKRISDLSNITVQLQEKARTLSQGGFVEGIGDACSAAMDTFLLALRVPVNALLWTLAYLPIWLPLLIAYRLLSRAYLRG